MQTTRALEEWIGKTPDSAVPPRVRDRIFTRYNGRCQCGCNRQIRPGEPWDAEDTMLAQEAVAREMSARHEPDR